MIYRRFHAIAVPAAAARPQHREESADTATRGGDQVVAREELTGGDGELLLLPLASLLSYGNNQPENNHK